jgi:hypothetical protein
MSTYTGKERVSLERDFWQALGILHPEQQQEQPKGRNARRRAAKREMKRSETKVNQA